MIAAEHTKSIIIRVRCRYQGISKLGYFPSLSIDELPFVYMEHGFKLITNPFVAAFFLQLTIEGKRICVYLAFLNAINDFFFLEFDKG